MDIDKTIRYAAILAGLLIVVAYFVGSTNLLSVGLSKGTTLYYAVTGRNAQGNFAPYPAGA